MKILYTIFLSIISPLILTANNIKECENDDGMRLTLAVQNINCFGEKGMAIAMATGGKAPLRYLWSNGETSQAVSNLSAGSLSVTVFDAENNETTANTKIIEPEELIVDVNWTNVDCYGGETGKATASVFGGMLPYIYKWSNGAETAKIENLPAGEYQVTISDKNGCEIIETILVEVPEPLDLTLILEHATNQISRDGSLVQHEIFGGIAPYKYFWSNGESGASIENLAPDFYQLIVTDVNNCEWFFEYEIGAETPQADLEVDENLNLNPNPVNLEISLAVEEVKNETYEKLDIEVLNYDGETILQKKAIWKDEQLETLLNVSDFSAGTYYLVILVKGKVWKTRKFVVES